MHCKMTVCHGCPGVRTFGWEALLDEITALTEEKLARLMKGCWLNEQMTVVLWRDFTHSTYL